MSSPRRPERAEGERRSEATAGGEDIRAPLTLASRSPQRRAILEQLGVEFDVVAPDVEELTTGDPAAVVRERRRREAAVEGSGAVPCSASQYGQIRHAGSTGLPHE